MLYLGLGLACAGAAFAACMLSFVRVFRPEVGSFCVSEAWEKSGALPIRGYRCCNALALRGTRRRFVRMYRGIAASCKSGCQPTHVQALFLRESGTVLRGLAYCGRNRRAFAGLETFEGVPLAVWRKLFELSGHDIRVELDGHDARMFARHERVYEAVALLLLLSQRASGFLQAEWWYHCCLRLKAILPDSEGQETQTRQPEICMLSGDFLRSRFRAVEAEMLQDPRLIREPIAAAAEGTRWELPTASCNGMCGGLLTHYRFGVLESDRLEAVALEDRLYLAVHEEHVFVRWRVTMVRQTDYELVMTAEGRTLTLTLPAVGALAVSCGGRIPMPVRRALMDLVQALKKRRIFCHLKLWGSRAYLLVGTRRDRLANLSRMLNVLGDYRLLAPLPGGAVPQRLGALMQNARQPSAFRMEQFWYALSGALPQIRADNLFDAADYLMVACDSRCTDRLLEEIAVLYIRLRRYFPNLCLLAVGRSRTEACRKLSFLQGGEWAKGIIFTKSANPNRRTLEKHALLCAKNGKLETINRERGKCMEHDKIGSRKIETSLDGMLGIDKLFEVFYAEQEDCGACREVVSDVLDCFMRLQIPYKLQIQDRIVEWFSLQSTDGKICARYSPVSLTEGGPYSTLLPIVLVMFYVQIFHDDAILQTQLTYRQDGDAPFDEICSESLFDVREAALCGIARRMQSSISDTLLFHVINGLSYCIESRQEGREDGLYRYFLNACLRFFSKKITNMSVRVRLLSGVRYCMPPPAGTLCDFILHEVFLKKNMLEAMKNFDIALTRLHELRGNRRKLAIALLIQFYYRRVLQISYRGQMVSVKPQLWLKDSYDVRIDRFTCKVTRGKSGVILGNIFYSNISYVSLDTKKNVTILSDCDQD